MPKARHKKARRLKAPPSAVQTTDTAELEQLVHRAWPVERLRGSHYEDPEAVPNDGYRLLDQLRDKVGGLLLLTATPMQLHDYELYSMIELVEPGLFNGYGDFAASREEISAVNGAVAALRSSRPAAAKIDECLELLRRYDAPTQLLVAATANRADREFAAIWLSRCHRLSHALVRNRKAEVGGFTKRRAHRIEVQPTDEELQLEQDVQGYIRDRFAAATSVKQTAVGLVLVAFQKMLCSSTRALAGALESRASRLLNEVEAEDAVLADDADFEETERGLRELPSDNAHAEAAQLVSLARRARRINDAKLVALDSLVASILDRDPNDKILIFSQFLHSIEMIRARLADRFSVRVFHGRMSREEKDKAHQAFRSAAQILISSEAGGEGRNFQFCHNVVNYDLPWNPMKIEQRIGRVDRVGQAHNVEIFNFAVSGLLDERILNVLEDRIQIFTETVGALDPILESLEGDLSRIALGDEGETDAAFGRLDENLDLEIRRARDLEELRRDFVLDWRSLQRDEASRVLGRKPRATREDLERFCRVAIERFPVGGIDDDPAGGLHIRVPGMLRRGRNGVEEDYSGSFEVGEALRNEGKQFFAMGHPLVEAILENVGDPWWLPITVLESHDWTSSEPALLVDYRLELYGIRDSGSLISHLVTNTGIHPPVRVVQPKDPMLTVKVPSWPASCVTKFAELSLGAARGVAAETFEEFKKENAALAEQELERLTRMFESRRGFLDDRIGRNEREIEHLELTGTPSQQRIIPARKGQVAADRKRIAELEKDRATRVVGVQGAIPSHHLRLLGAAIIVPPGNLEELRA
jgi:hypothetical protein